MELMFNEIKLLIDRGGFIPVPTWKTRYAGHQLTTHFAVKNRIHSRKICGIWPYSHLCGQCCCEMPLLQCQERAASRIVPQRRTRRLGYSGTRFISSLGNYTSKRRYCSASNALS